MNECISFVMTKIERISIHAPSSSIFIVLSNIVEEQEAHHIRLVLVAEDGHTLVGEAAAHNLVEVVDHNLADIVAHSPAEVPADHILVVEIAGHIPAEEVAVRTLFVAVADHIHRERRTVLQVVVLRTVPVEARHSLLLLGASPAHLGYHMRSRLHPAITSLATVYWIW